MECQPTNVFFLSFIFKAFSSYLLLLKVCACIYIYNTFNQSIKALATDTCHLVQEFIVGSAKLLFLNCLNYIQTDFNDRPCRYISSNIRL